MDGFSVYFSKLTVTSDMQNVEETWFAKRAWKHPEAWKDSIILPNLLLSVEKKDVLLQCVHHTQSDKVFIFVITFFLRLYAFT